MTSLGLGCDGRPGGGSHPGQQEEPRHGRKVYRSRIQDYEDITKFSIGSSGISPCPSRSSPPARTAGPSWSSQCMAPTSLAMTWSGDTELCTPPWPQGDTLQSRIDKTFITRVIFPLQDCDVRARVYKRPPGSGGLDVGTETRVCRPQGCGQVSFVTKL